MMANGVRNSCDTMDTNLFRNCPNSFSLASVLVIQSMLPVCGEYSWPPASPMRLLSQSTRDFSLLRWIG